MGIAHPTGYPIAYWQAVLAAVQRVLKPGGDFVFDVVNGDAAIAENWAILETYFGAEVFLETEADWRSLLKTADAKITSHQTGELFTLDKVRWGSSGLGPGQVLPRCLETLTGTVKNRWYAKGLIGDGCEFLPNSRPLTLFICGTYPW